MQCARTLFFISYTSNKVKLYFGPKATAPSTLNQIILVFIWAAQYAAKYFFRGFRGDTDRVGEAVESKSGEF